MLAQMGDLLTRGKKGDLAKAYQGGDDMLFKIKQKQVGSGIGSLTASIGILIVLDALRGKGIGRGSPRIGKTGHGGVRIGGTHRGKGSPRMGMPLAPPPFLGTWPATTGRGKKKRKDFLQRYPDEQL